MEYLHDAYVTNLNAVCRISEVFKLGAGQSRMVEEHRFSQNKFYYFLKGRCQLYIEDQPVIACGGDWFFIPAGTKNSYVSLPGETFEKYWCHFDLSPENIAQLLRLPVVIHAGEDAEVLRLFQSMTDAFSRDGLTDRLRTKSALLSLLARYIELSHADKILVQGEDDCRIHEILQHMNTHLAESLNNADLAAMCHMHPNHFIRYFSQKTGQTPYRYLTVKRMETAKQLLEQTELPISQIMERTGIQDSGYFARLFRQHYAMSPSQYRQYSKASAD